MRTSKSLFVAALVAVGGFVLAGAGFAQHDGEEMNVHNRTGHEVLVFLFDDGHVHLSEEGGVQIAHLHDGESAVADAPHCHFALLLVDHDDLWHAEFNDCHSTDLVFTADTNHTQRHH